MGVIYKLKPEIKIWILEKKRANPVLSCRGIVSLVEKEFKIKVSKSSINSIFKEAGLSMPVGRRQKKRRHKVEIPTLLLPELKTETLLLTAPAPPELPRETPAPTQPEAPLEVSLKTPAQIQPETAKQTPIQLESEIHQKMLSSGIILLKAMDYLLGGTYYIIETIKRRLTLKDDNLLAKIEGLIYAPLWEISEELFKTYLNELQIVEPIVQDILRVLFGGLTEVRCIKVHLSDGEDLYLDGQLHTVWSVPHIPYDFVNTIYNVEHCINKYFYKAEPLILFMAPGYDTPTAEFFNFILSLEHREKKVGRLSLYGNKLEEMESFPLEQNKKRLLVFGLWPWQYPMYRRVKKIEEFKPFYFQAQEKTFYLADIEVELLGPNKKQSIDLVGYALKTNLSEKTRLIIMSNMPKELATAEYLANTYLNCWPNLEEAFQDFSRKVELFTYTADSQRFFSPESLNFYQDRADIKELSNHYLKVLDLYFKWHFLPSGYENKDFSAIKDQFYNLKAVSQTQKDHILITFQPPQEFPSLKALEYACRRLNEREIILNDDKRLWFSL